MTFWQAVAFVIGLYASSKNPFPKQPRDHAVVTDDRPLPPNENPYTTDDSWDCYTEAEPDGQPVAYVCVTEKSPCHYKRSKAECTMRIVWLPTKLEEVKHADRAHSHR